MGLDACCRGEDKEGDQTVTMRARNNRGTVETRKTSFVTVLRVLQAAPSRGAKACSSHSDVLLCFSAVMKGHIKEGHCYRLQAESTPSEPSSSRGRNDFALSHLVIKFGNAGKTTRTNGQRHKTPQQMTFSHVLTAVFIRLGDLNEPKSPRARLSTGS